MPPVRRLAETVMLAARYDAFLFDLDGVLYLGDEVVDGAADAISRLRSLGKRVAFVTNNSGRTSERVAERLRSMGIPADGREVETSAHTTATVLAARGMQTAFVIGEVGLVAALSRVGIEVVGAPRRPDVVVVGWDRGADYAKLRTASILVQRGALLVATNPDGSFPAADGTRWPGAGALLAAVEATTGVRGEVMGKPFPPLFLAARERAGGGRPLVIGDRLDTDIAGAARLGWDSMLVLTGISSAAEARDSDVRPTYVAERLAALFTTP